MSSDEDVVLSFQNSLLRSSDLNILRGPHWLNDQIISFYMEYLETYVYHGNKEMLFVSPEVVQCIKLVSKNEVSIFLDPLKANERQFIFLPLNDNNEDRAGGCHWSLLVFSRPERTFFHFDSFDNINLKNCYKFAPNLSQAIDCSEFEIISGDCLHQSNSYDCGIHVLCNIEALAEQIVEKGRIQLDDDDSNESKILAVTPSIISKKRKDLLHLIEQLKQKR